MHAPDETLCLRSIWILFRIKRQLWSQKIMHHGGDQGAREKIRGQHGENHSHGQRRKQIFGRACQHDYRNENDADGKGETRVGTAICWAPSRMARVSGFFIAILRCTFSISTVASSTRIPTARANPPRVITFTVSPKAVRIMMEVRMARGIEVQTINVLRQLPRNSKIMSAVKNAAIPASRSTPYIEARTKIDWSNRGVIFNCGGSVDAMRGRALFTSLTILSVDALPFFRTVRRAERAPLVRTMLV